MPTHGVRARRKSPHAAALLPQKRAILRHDPAIRDQQAAPRNHAAIVKVVVSDHFEFRLMSAARISVCYLLRLHMLVQFFLAIFQTNGDIRGAFSAPEEIEVIAIT